MRWGSGFARSRNHSTIQLTVSCRKDTFTHMVEDQNLDDVFHALADPTRRAMLKSLSQSRHTVGELAEPFAISLAAASKHIKVLERAGLVRRNIEGRTHICRLDAAPLHAGMEWIRHYEKYWNERLDALASLLEADAAADSKEKQAIRKEKKP
jgi:DNA-binding transcriptional ArsR family regulator